MKIADKGARLGNCIIDSVAIVIIYIFVSVILTILDPAIIDDGLEILNIIIVLVFIFYYVIFESIWAQTPGKWLTKTRVADASGKKPGIGRVFIRTITRLIPVDGLAFIFGNAGLHDVISRTTVVSTQSSSSLVTME